MQIRFTAIERFIVGVLLSGAVAAFAGLAGAVWLVPQLDQRITWLENSMSPYTPEMKALADYRDDGQERRLRILEEWARRDHDILLRIEARLNTQEKQKPP